MLKGSVEGVITAARTSRMITTFLRKDRIFCAVTAPRLVKMDIVCAVQDITRGRRTHGSHRFRGAPSRGSVPVLAHRQAQSWPSAWRASGPEYPPPRRKGSHWRDARASSCLVVSETVCILTSDGPSRMRPVMLRVMCGGAFTAPALALRICPAALHGVCASPLHTPRL